MANFYVNQSQIEEFIHENNIDRNDSNQTHLIVDYYKTTHQDIKDLNIIYQWNQIDEMHEFFDFRGTNFIRDDLRFTNERYHRQLVGKYHCLFPECLTDINMYLRTATDAIEIADALAVFFKDDEDLMRFADWLRITSNNCAYYELSR
jgi:hypothetical protein